MTTPENMTTPNYELHLLPDADGYPVYARGPHIRIDGFAADAWTLNHLSDREKEALAVLALSDWQAPTGKLASYGTAPNGQPVILTPQPPQNLQAALRNMTALVCAVDGRLELEQTYTHLLGDNNGSTLKADTTAAWAWLQPEPLATYLKAKACALVRVFHFGPPAPGGAATTQTSWQPPGTRLTRDHYTTRYENPIAGTPPTLIGTDVLYPDMLSPHPIL